MNITQLSEQLKDVPQGTLVGYAKNPNSVVPQFLALAEIQRRQQLQAPMSAPTGTVADDVLAQATPMPQQMAPQQVDPRLLQAQAMQQQAQQLPENQPGVAQLPSGMPQGMASGGIVAFASGGDAEEDEDYQDYLDSREKTKRNSRFDEMFSGLKDRVAGIASSMPQSYEETKNSYQPTSSAQPEGIEGLLAKVGHLESGNKDYDKYGRLITSPKGAEGRMQTLRSTQRDPGYGVMAARNSSVEEKNRVGEDYFKAMLSEFKDPKVAAMAYNWGPGNVKKWIDSGYKLPIPEETRKYASHFAEGGIARLATGDLIDPYKSLSAGEEIIPETLSAPVLEKQANPLEEYLKQLRSEREEIKAGQSTDASLALMQAGLGMMAGTSPYALTNVGLGGMQGLAAYQAAQKQRAVELAALRKAEGSGLEASQIYEYRQQQLKDQADIKNRQLQSLNENRQERIRIADEKLSSAADVAANIKQAKIDDLTTKTLAAAARNPQYKYYTKMLENNPPDSPEYQQAVEALQTIENAYLANAGIKNAKPISIPQLAPKVEEPGFLKDIFTKAGQRIFGAPSSSGVELSPKQQDLLNKYK
jgi:hypothetical protein